MLEDVICDIDTDIVEMVESNILTEKLINIIKGSLSNREYKILCMRYGIGGGVAYTQREVAKKLGISRSYISRLEKKAIETVRAEVHAKKIYTD